MKKIFCTLAIVFAMLPLAVIIILGPAKPAALYQQWSSQTLTAAAKRGQQLQVEAGIGHRESNGSIGVVENKGCAIPLTLAVIYKHNDQSLPNTMQATACLKR